MIIDLDIESYYPGIMWTVTKKPRTLTLEKLEPPHRHRVQVYVQGGNWFEDKQVMEEWCGKNFGHHSKHYNNPRWCRDAFHFKFKNEKDATMFILRWMQ